MNNTVKIIIQVVMALLKYILIPLAENKLDGEVKREIWKDIRDLANALDTGWSFISPGDDNG